jgi:hypothetical protein
MEMGAINWLAVGAAAVSSFVIGGLWYGPLFGRAWMRASGISDDQARRANQAVIFSVSFILQLIAAAVLAMFIGADASLAFAVSAAGSVGLFWVATAFGVVYLFEQRPLAHWAVNAGYQVVAFVVMGVILGVWR